MCVAGLPGRVRDKALVAGRVAAARWVSGGGVEVGEVTDAISTNSLSNIFNNKKIIILSKKQYKELSLRTLRNVVISLNLQALARWKQYPLLINNTCHSDRGDYEQ